MYSRGFVPPSQQTLSTTCMPFLVEILRCIDLKHRQNLVCRPRQPTSCLCSISLAKKVPRGWRDNWRGISQATKRIHAEMMNNDESKSKEQLWVGDSNSRIPKEFTPSQKGEGKKKKKRKKANNSWPADPEKTKNDENFPNIAHFAHFLA